MKIILEEILDCNPGAIVVAIGLAFLATLAATYLVDWVAEWLDARRNERHQRARRINQRRRACGLLDSMTYEDAQCLDAMIEIAAAGEEIR